MNPALVKQALERVLDRHVLVNLVSRRVRQLTTSEGARNGPLVAGAANLCAADIALRELIEGRMDFEMPAVVPLTRPTGQGRRRPQHWARS